MSANADANPRWAELGPSLSDAAEQVLIHHAGPVGNMALWIPSRPGAATATSRRKQSRTWGERHLTPLKGHVSCRATLGQLASRRQCVQRRRPTRQTRTYNKLWPTMSHAYPTDAPGALQEPVYAMLGRRGAGEWPVDLGLSATPKSGRATGQTPRQARNRKAPPTTRRSTYDALRRQR